MSSKKGSNKDKRIEIRVTTEEKQAIEDSAKVRNISVGSLLIEGALNMITPFVENKGEIARGLVDIAHEINYIKRYKILPDDDIKELDRLSERVLELWRILV